MSVAPFPNEEYHRGYADGYRAARTAPQTRGVMVLSENGAVEIIATELASWEGGKAPDDGDRGDAKYIYDALAKNTPPLGGKIMGDFSVTVAQEVRDAAMQSRQPNAESGSIPQSPTPDTKDAVERAFNEALGLAIYDACHAKAYMDFGTHGEELQYFQNRLKAENLWKGVIKTYQSTLPKQDSSAKAQYSDVQVRALVEAGEDISAWNIVIMRALKAEERDSVWVSMRRLRKTLAPFKGVV